MNSIMWQCCWRFHHPLRSKKKKLMTTFKTIFTVSQMFFDICTLQCFTYTFCSFYILVFKLAYSLLLLCKYTRKRMNIVLFSLISSMVDFNIFLRSLFLANWKCLSSSAPSLRPMAVGKRRQELRGSVSDMSGGGGIGVWWVDADARSVYGACVWVVCCWVVRTWWSTPARPEWRIISSG